MQTLEELIESARRLPPEEQKRLRDALDQTAERRASPVPTSPRTYRTHEAERAWIEAHRDEYLGQWVALDGDRLLAHGANAREVAETARAAGVKAPFVERIEPKPETDAFMGGWL